MKKIDADIIIDFINEEEGGKGEVALSESRINFAYLGEERFVVTPRHVDILREKNIQFTIKKGSYRP